MTAQHPLDLTPEEQVRAWATNMRDNTSPSDPVHAIGQSILGLFERVDSERAARDLLASQLATALETLEYAPDETAKRIAEWVNEWADDVATNEDADRLRYVSRRIERGDWRR